MTHTAILASLALLALALQCIDFVATITNIRHGGRETTRLTRGLMEHLGMVPGMLVAKLIAVVLIAALCWFGSIAGLVAMVVVYVYVAWVNFKVARELGII